MNRWKPFASIGLGLVAIAGGLGWLTDHFSKTHTKAHYALAVVGWVALILVLVGTALYGFAQLRGMFAFIWKWIVKTISGRIEAPHDFKYATWEDLGLLHKMYEDEFATEVPTLEAMQSWHRKCKKAFVMVYRTSSRSSADSDGKFIGSFKFLPLTVTGINGLETKLVRGSTFRTTDICARPNDATAYYIGDVVSTGCIAGGHVLDEIRTMCKLYWKKKVTFYARPLTDKGYSVMRNSRFRRVSDGSLDFKIGDLCKRTTDFNERRR